MITQFENWEDEYLNKTKFAAAKVACKAFEKDEDYRDKVKAEYLRHAGLLIALPERKPKTEPEKVESEATEVEKPKKSRRKKHAEAEI